MPLYYDDYEALEPGHRWHTGERTITQAEVDAFAASTGDTNPIHIDAAYANASSFGGTIVHGYLTIALAAGLVYRLGLDEVASHAILSTNWKLTRAVHPGQAIRVVLTLVSRRPSRSQPGHGIITRRYDVLNDRGDPVAIGEVTMLILGRGAPAP